MTNSCETNLKKHIEHHGPIPLDQFITFVSAAPQYGYYSQKQAIGQSGDFITAPEVSQMFGEVIGAWCVNLWQQLGSPDSLNLIELGPGRGTLLADILRITRNITNFHQAIHIKLVEINPLLKKIQYETISHPNVSWHNSFEEIPKNSSPSIIIGNEFFDVLPIKQIKLEQSQYLERAITLNQGKLEIIDIPYQPSCELQIKSGITEYSPMAESLMENICLLLKETSGCFLMIDYGYDSGQGESLQAVFKHQKCGILEHIGEADISAHVNFGTLKKIAQKKNLGVSSLISQNEFLTQLGIHTRLQMLKKNATTKEQAKLELDFQRLTNPMQMGSLFKVMATYSLQSI